jgi:hypothetical protein
LDQQEAEELIDGILTGAHPRPAEPVTVDGPPTRAAVLERLVAGPQLDPDNRVASELDSYCASRLVRAGVPVEISEGVLYRLADAVRSYSSLEVARWLYVLMSSPLSQDSPAAGRLAAQVRHALDLFRELSLDPTIAFDEQVLGDYRRW